MEVDVCGATYRLPHNRCTSVLVTQEPFIGTDKAMCVCVCHQHTIADSVNPVTCTTRPVNSIQWCGAWTLGIRNGSHVNTHTLWFIVIKMFHCKTTHLTGWLWENKKIKKNLFFFFTKNWTIKKSPVTAVKDVLVSYWSIIDFSFFFFQKYLIRF